MAQLYSVATEERSDASLSREEQAWKSCFPAMSMLLEQSYLSVANAAFQEELIDFDLLNSVTTKRLIVSSKEQAMNLLVCLFKKMQSSAATAQHIMATFIQILEMDSSLDSLRSELKQMLSTEKGPNPELQVFQKKMVALAGLLQCQVASIATACHDRGLIALDEMTIITNPGAMHSKYSIDKILTDVGQKIKEDPKNLELFVASVLEPMGKFADNLVCSLRRRV